MTQAGGTKQRKRVKWEPYAAMVAFVLVGVWLVVRPGVNLDLRPGARAAELRMGPVRGALETHTDAEGVATYRFLYRDGSTSKVLSESEFREIVSESAFERISRPDNLLFRLFNITTWSSMVWIAIGLGGQLVFSFRFLIQWIVSEKERRSVIPDIFWWISLIGAVCLFAYFAWRRDIVGVLGQSSGVVIYARNLRLIHKQKRREAREAARTDSQDADLDAAMHPPQDAGERNDDDEEVR